MPYAYGFRNPRKLLEHFIEHGWQFSSTRAIDYERRAINFLQVVMVDGVIVFECINAAGETVRFNINTNEFAVVDTFGIIRTYFKPIPRHRAPRGTRLRNTHGFRSNFEYDESNC